jgi:hypothetical protein
MKRAENLLVAYALVEVLTREFGALSGTQVVVIDEPVAELRLRPCRKNGGGSGSIRVSA